MTEASSLIAELEQALATGSAERRTRMLARFSELFDAGSGRHSDAELAFFEDVLTRLTAAIERTARARLARHLAPLANAPRGVIRSLAFDDAIEVAGPVLRHSPQLDDADLVANATTKSQEHLRAIAQRPTLSEVVTDVLVDRGDGRTLHSVTQNQGARFSPHGFGRLVERAANDDSLAGILGARDDLPRHHLLKLLVRASDAVRAKLEAANPQARAAIQHLVGDIAADIGDGLRRMSADHTKAKAAIKRRYLTCQLGEADLHTGACGQDFERTAVALALLGPYPIEMVERALIDRAPDMILVLLKAVECSRMTVKSVLKMRVADRGLSPDALEAALAGYDRLRKGTAKRILAFHRRRHASIAKALSRSARAGGKSRCQVQLALP
ncbi:MAG: DUF2336 domain-containing protein [Variibacter sp.]|nr:DUF2336 domain-containing protein [Variibacter sp.]